MATSVELFCVMVGYVFVYISGSLFFTLAKAVQWDPVPEVLEPSDYSGIINTKSVKPCSIKASKNARQR